jgi:hypothetical protein
MASLTHGTERAWRACRKMNDGVACEACKSAKNKAWREAKQKRKLKPIPVELEHGEYVRRHYGCGCEVCIARTREAEKIRKRQSRARKKEAMT